MQKKITKHEAKLDWKKSAIELERKIRAYNPFPVAHTNFNGIDLRIWEAKVKASTLRLKPGALLKG